MSGPTAREVELNGPLALLEGAAVQLIRVEAARGSYDRINRKKSNSRRNWYRNGRGYLALQHQYSIEERQTNCQDSKGGHAQHFEARPP